MRKIIIAFSALLLVLALALTTLAQNTGIVCALVGNVNVRSAPDLRFNAVGATTANRCYTAYDLATPNATQTREAPIDIWYQIQYSTQTRGWVAGNWGNNTYVIVTSMPMPTSLIVPTNTPSPTRTLAPTATQAPFSTPTPEQYTGTPIYVAPEIRIGKIRIIIEFDLEASHVSTP